MKKRFGEFGFSHHAAEKQASRDQDAIAISQGASVKSLREKNFMLSGVDFSKAVAVDSQGRRYFSPK